MLQNVEDGNGLSQWLAGLVALCLGLNILFWLAHPDSSYLWRQVCWLGLGAGDPEKFFKVDFCTYNTIWRKKNPLPNEQQVAGCSTVVSRWSQAFGFERTLYFPQLCFDKGGCRIPTGSLLDPGPRSV